MPSLNAIAVAKDVQNHIRKGKKVNMGKILKEHGYSDTVQRAIQPVTRTKSYIDTITPFIKRLENHRNDILKAMETKDLNGEDYRILSESLDRMTKNLNLLQGKPTDNMAVSVSMVSYADTSTLVQHDSTSTEVHPPLVIDNNIDNV